MPIFYNFLVIYVIKFSFEKKLYIIHAKMCDNKKIKKKFFHSLKRGTGEAYLLARENPTIDFSKYIIKGALNNYAYDGQCEGSRADYILDLISLSNKKDKIRKAVLKGLATEQEDTWSLTHLFDLAKLYAQQGDKVARQAIYDRFLANPVPHSDWVGYSEILELDGFKGLLFIAEKFGKHIDKNPNYGEDNSIIRHFQDENPNINVLEELEKASKTNKFIKIYLDCIQRTEANYKNAVREKQIFTDIIDEVLNSKPFISFKRRRELNELELIKIAEHLLSEKNKIYVEKLLWVFKYHKFPLDSEFILKLAKQKTISKNRIKEYAIDALRFLQSNDIRRFALKKITTSKRPELFVDILVANYQTGDNKLLAATAEKVKSKHIIEHLASSYVDIFRANKTSECKEPLEILYSKMNCGIHRNDIIEVLIENNVLSKKLNQEIEFDSYLETRQLHQTFFKNDTSLREIEEVEGNV
jgi:hypothetical protein